LADLDEWSDRADCADFSDLAAWADAVAALAAPPSAQPVRMATTRQTPLKTVLVGIKTVRG
jgi:hypothetical protein